MCGAICRPGDISPENRMEMGRRDVATEATMFARAGRNDSHRGARMRLPDIGVVERVPPAQDHCLRLGFDHWYLTRASELCLYSQRA